MTNKDKLDWENFSKNPSNVFDKDKEKTIRDYSKKFKFDFHGYSINDANKKVREIITKCHKQGYSEILIITGKGSHSRMKDSVYVSAEYSKLKGSIPDFIRNNSDLSSKIVSIKEASEKMGGQGALIIKLKKL